MSASETERIVRGIYERWNATADVDPDRGGDLALDLFHPDAQIHQTGALIDTAGSFHGPQGLVASARELSEAFSTILWLAEDWTEMGDWLVVRINFRATGRGSGLVQDIDVVHAWRSAEGKIVAFHVYASMREATEALQSAGDRNAG